MTSPQWPPSTKCSTRRIRGDGNAHGRICSGRCAERRPRLEEDKVCLRAASRNPTNLNFSRGYRRSAHLPEHIRPWAFPSPRIRRVLHFVEGGHCGEVVDVPAAFLFGHRAPTDPACQSTGAQGTTQVHVEARLHVKRSQPAGRNFQAPGNSSAQGRRCQVSPGAWQAVGRFRIFQASPPSYIEAITMSLAYQRLTELISACFTGLWVQLFERQDALENIAQTCRQENWRFVGLGP